ncbi:MAG: NAD(+) synthase [Lachnospiraceae bacterium]|nr:NAD(+) synthase [Lachnospiraceae bacterium]
MKDHFIRTACITPEVTVADPAANRAAIETALRACAEDGVKIAVLPELALTGYTCADLFLQSSLIEAAKAELFGLAAATADLDLLFFVGLPWQQTGTLYNVMAAVFGGDILCLIPKTYIPSYNEFYEMRHFTPGWREPRFVTTAGPDGEDYEILMGTDILLEAGNVEGCVIAGEICEDLWVAQSPGAAHALAGATIIVNASASPDEIAKDEFRRDMVSMQSARYNAAYLYACAGPDESTTDLVFAGHDIICEDGRVLAESELMTNGIITAEIDLEKLVNDRRRMNTFTSGQTDDHAEITFRFRDLPELELRRFVDPAPFVPRDEATRFQRCEHILAIQAQGLATRMKKIHSTCAVVGLSGGLDSTLALLVTVRAFEKLGLDPKDIIAITMPCFGTTDRTYTNACTMAKETGATLREIDIKAAVRQHFADIGHDETDRNVTYENSQARERTQILMDVANDLNGLVIGTGDLSELALGWATYNGDHMSMYGVNGSVPKTLVRHLVRTYADTTENRSLAAALYDVLDTPVSPELLPPEENGEIAQKTEDLVGPYELHDFFIFQVLRYGYRPAKVYRLAKIAFAGRYEDEVILKWLKNFYRRFFTQQFKRSCLPDGPKVGSVAVSPRGDLRMPSDASSALWLREVEELS